MSDLKQTLFQHAHILQRLPSTIFQFLLHSYVNIFSLTAPTLSVFGHNGSDSRKLCNSESFHVQLFDHRAELTSRALLFPLFLSLLSQVRVDRRHGWVVSGLSSGGSWGPQGSCEVGQQLESGKKKRQATMAERGKNSSLLFHFVCFFHVGAKDGDTG